MPAFQEFDVVVRMRGVRLTQQSATELLAAMLDREMDHGGDDWGTKNKMSLMVPARKWSRQGPWFYPGDDHYER